MSAIEHVSDDSDHSEFEDDAEENPDNDGAFDFFSGRPQESNEGTALGPEQEDPGTTARTGKRWQWDPLSEVNDIRILRITHMKEGDDTIHCSFRLTSLDRPLPYIALSYVWGPTYSDGRHFTHAIICEGMPLRITANLHRALVCLRATSKPQDCMDYWIDAICIDQINDLERGRQVMIMDRIFGNAAHLMVWLGDLELNDIRGLLSPTPEPGDIFPLPLDPEGDYAHNPSPWTRKVYQIRPWRTKTIPWFRRLWIVQEIIACRAGRTILMGPRRLQVSNLIALVAREDLFQGTPEDNVEQESTLVDTVRESSLLENLIRFTHCRCRDPRDKLYALRNISRDGCNFIVDYRKSVQEAYTALADHYISKGQWLAILTLAAESNTCRQQIKGPFRWPTWVPDWRYPLYIKGPSWKQTPAQVQFTPVLDSGAERITVLEAAGWLIRICGYHGLEISHDDPIDFEHKDEKWCVYCFHDSRVHSQHSFAHEFEQPRSWPVVDSWLILDGLEPDDTYNAIPLESAPDNSDGLTSSYTLASAPARLPNPWSTQLFDEDMLMNPPIFGPKTTVYIR